MTLKVLVHKEPFTCLLEKTRVFFPASWIFRQPGACFPFQLSKNYDRRRRSFSGGSTPSERNQGELQK